MRMRSSTAVAAAALLLLASVAVAEDGYGGKSVAEWKALLSGPKALAAQAELAKGGLEAARVCVAIIRDTETFHSPPHLVYLTLMEIGTAAEEIFPELAELHRQGRLFQEDGKFVDLLVAVGRNRNELGTVLKWGLSHEYYWVRNPSAYALADLGLYDGRTISILVNDILPWSDESELYLACRAISKIGEDAQGAVKNLSIVVDHDEEFVRFAALQALIDIGEKGHQQIERLVLGGKTDIQIVSAIWLGAQRGKSRRAVKNLRKALTDDYHEEVQAAAALALGMIGEDADSAATDLFDALDDESDLVREYAGRALTMLGEKGETKLRHALGSTSKRVVEAATAALPLLEEKGDRVVETLLGLLARPRHAPAAVESLGRMGKGVVPRLIEALADPRAPVRAGAARALGMMSAGAADAIPALEKLLEDENDAVRDEAKQALGWIRTG